MRGRQQGFTMAKFQQERWLQPMWERQQGFTLVETILAASLMLLVLVSALSILGAGLQWWQRGWDQMDAQQNARVALARMAGEIRTAREVVAGSDDHILIVATSGGDQYKYELAGDNLRRAVKNKGAYDFSGDNPLAYGVQALQFSYDRPEAPEKSKIIFIRLVVRDAQGRDFTITTRVALRLRIMNSGNK
ncbi:prepilin-type N-terminal cleavage/methylation domain-containing protein [Moorella naiadis]|uniref:PilW family protein n=1 Tax=Moorella naiadis (nom. illeg.) TaxID=3093670 RepID=UPI003D9CBCA0